MICIKVTWSHCTTFDALPTILHSQTREERLTEAFEKYGTIKECRVARTSIVKITIYCLLILIAYILIEPFCSLFFFSQLSQAPRDRGNPSRPHLIIQNNPWKLCDSYRLYFMLRFLFSSNIPANSCSWLEPVQYCGLDRASRSVIGSKGMWHISDEGT